MNKIKWTKEMCCEEALKYETRREFKKNSGAAFYYANKNNWIDDVCSHMIQKFKPHNYWSKEKCHEEALKYESRNDFSIFSSGAYRTSINNNWIDDICSHMQFRGNKMLRCIYSYEFSDNRVYVGLTYNITVRNSVRKLKKDDAVTKYINESGLTPIIKQLTEYVDVNEASLLENKFIEMYRENGWILLNRIRGGTVGGNTLIWTKVKCQNEALKYNSFSDFKKYSDSAYKSAKRNGWFDEITIHINGKFRKWNYDNVKLEALKYGNRYGFYKNSMAAYMWAIRHDILDDVCTHMKCKK